MPAAPLPVDEAARLEALRRSGLLDSGRNRRLDEIVWRAAAIAGTQVAAISLVAETDQYFKAGIGFGVPHTPRDVSFCAYVLLDRRPLVILDARLDARFADNALVIMPPRIRFYAGAPVYGEGPQPFGALFVMDNASRSNVSAALVASLCHLAEEASAILAASRSAD